MGYTTLNITGGDMTATQRVAQIDVSGKYARSEINITGGTIGCTANSGNAVFHVDTVYAATPAEGSVSVKINGTENGTPKIEANSGALFEQVSGKESAMTAVVSGGLFDCVIDSKYVATGYVCTNNTDPATEDAYPYIVKQPDPVAQIGTGESAQKFTTLAAAIAAVPTNNTTPVTIELLNNIVLDSTVAVNKNNVTIDGEGFTISADNSKSEWQQYKVGGANAGLGKINLITVSGTNVTVKDVTVDVKDYRGMTCMTTNGGTNVAYENVTYEGRGSGHYKAYANGTLTFKDCTVNTKGYAFHVDSGACTVTIDGCTVHGWCSFGKSVTAVTAKNSTFYGANDEGKNGLLALLRPYCPTTLTNCTFSSDYLTTPSDEQGGDDKDYTGLGTGDAVTVVLNGCKVEGNVAKVYEIVDYDSAFDNKTAADGSVFAFDAKVDAQGKYTAGTFVTKADSSTINVADGYQLSEIADNTYTVTAKAIVDTDSGKIVVGTDEEGNPKVVEVLDEGGEPVSTDKAQAAATAINETLDNPAVTGFTETKIDEAIPEVSTENIEEIAKNLELDEGETITAVSAPSMSITLASATVGTAGENTVVTEMTFDVHPVVEVTVEDASGNETTKDVSIDNDAIESKITFRLPVDSSVTEEWAAIYHEDEFFGTYPVQSDDTAGKYVEVSSNEFSLYGYKLFSDNDAAAKIGDIPYQTLAEAVAAVKDGETITLLKDSESGAITVSREVTFTVNNGGFTNNATIVAGETFELNKTSVTDGTEYAVLKRTGNTDGGSGSSGGGSTTYAVTVESAKNGAVSADKKSTYSGNTVTITVAPDKGFTLETLTVTDKNGKEITVKNLGNNKFSFKMPASKVTVEATFMEDNTMLNFFVDVPATEYYYDAVLWAAENGITTGVDAVHFGPEAPVTRGQVVTFLWRAAGSPKLLNMTANGPAPCPFKDVATDAYYYHAVMWAISEGITTGVTDTAFEPEMVCTRGQIVTFLARFAGVKDAETESVFTDVPATEFFAAAVKWAKDNGVTSGITETTFEPYTNCNRAQVVTFLYRWMVK